LECGAKRRFHFQRQWPPATLNKSHFLAATTERGRNFDARFIAPVWVRNLDIRATICNPNFGLRESSPRSKDAMNFPAESEMADVLCTRLLIVRDLSLFEILNPAFATLRLRAFALSLRFGALCIEISF
jgi:hypothetical protein